MQVWEHCFHHVVGSKVFQLQLHVIFRLCGHEMSVDIPLRGDLRGDNSFLNRTLTKSSLYRLLTSKMCQECSNGSIFILRQIRRVNTWQFSGIKDAH